MGEFELLEAIRSRLPAPGPRIRLGSGDDAAIVEPGGATATSVDALIDGVHFRREWASLEQIGRKALAVALSDLAAMGAEAGEAYVVLGVPTDLDEEGCLAILDGMVAPAADSGTTLAGGDITRAPALTLAVTVVGHARSADDFVTRAGAAPGDALVVTGELGGAAAGLLVLRRSPSGAWSRSEPHSETDLAPAGSFSDDGPLVQRQLEPTPRLRAGCALSAAGATAMIDLSDGLGGDARHLSAASGVGLRIDAGALPIQQGVIETAAATGLDPIEVAVSGGEDYELLAALPPARLEEARSALATTGTKLTQIGVVLAGEGVEIRLPGGGDLQPRGFDQLGRAAPP